MANAWTARKGQQYTKDFMDKKCKLNFVGDGKDSFPEVAKYLSQLSADDSVEKVFLSCMAGTVVFMLAAVFQAPEKRCDCCTALIFGLIVHY